MQQKKPLKNFTFTFANEENNIEVWISAISGKEKVYVNNELVSESRNLKANSSHNFTIDNDAYSVNIKTDNIFRGPIFCTLLKNGEEFKKQKLIFDKVKRFSKEYFINIIRPVIMGLLFGFLFSYMDLSSSYLLLFIGFLFMLIFAHAFIRQIRHIRIEEEEV